MDRFPAGLTYSALIAALSIGCLTLFGGLGAHGGRGPAPLVHTAAALCLGWCLVAWWVGAAAGPHRSNRLEAVSVLNMAALAMGLLASLIIIYAAVIETLCRTVYLEYELPLRVGIWRSGTLDVVMLILAVFFSWKRTDQGVLMTALFWLMILCGLWLSFEVPAAERIGPSGAYYLIPSRWASVWMLSTAFSVAALTALQGWQLERHRLRAWPEHLENLTLPASGWPGFDLSAGIAGVLILLLGCVYMVLPISAVSGFVAGAALLRLVHRRWNENLADAGLALITLGVLSACMLGFRRPVWTARGYAEILNRTLLGLAIMTAVWHWLARVWGQQLDDRRAWTTTGRLVPTARRVGFIMAATGVLIGLHLTLWPKLPHIVNSDDSPLRWAAGLGGHVLLFFALLAAMYDTRRSTLGWLALFTIASSVGFVISRAPNARFSAWFMVHWPLALAMVAGLCVLCAWALRNQRVWRGLQEPLILTGIMLAPMIALTGVCLTDAALLGQSPPWLPAGTFGVLAIGYVIAAVYPGPRTFMTVAALCCGVGIWKLRDLSAHRFLTSPYFFTLLSGVSLILVASAFRSRAHAGAMRLLTWLGGGLVVLSLLAGWLLAR